MQVTAAPHIAFMNAEMDMRSSRRTSKIHHDALVKGMMQAGFDAAPEQLVAALGPGAPDG